MILSLGFDIINLHSILLNVNAYNKRGIRSYQKAGFKEVGKKRENHYLEGVYHDVIIMDILEEEYLQISRKKASNWPIIR